MDGTGANNGLQIGWNYTGGIGESDFLNWAQGGGGGFNFYSIGSGFNQKKLVSISNTSSSNRNGSYGSIDANSLSTPLIQSLFNISDGHCYFNGNNGQRLLLTWGLALSANNTYSYNGFTYAGNPTIIATGNGGGGNHSEAINISNVTTSNFYAGQYNWSDPFYWIAIGLT